MISRCRAPVFGGWKLCEKSRSRDLNRRSRRREKSHRRSGTERRREGLLRRACPRPRGDGGRRGKTRQRALFERLFVLSFAMHYSRTTVYVLVGNSVFFFRVADFLLYRRMRFVMNFRPDNYRSAYYNIYSRKFRLRPSGKNTPTIFNTWRSSQTPSCLASIFLIGYR